MKLWQKDKVSLNEVDRFTIGQDQIMDLYLAQFDVIGSLAHIQMLESIGLLTSEELKILSTELKNIYNKILAGEFKVEEGVEDIHSQIELELTKKRGDIGKKIHSGRSRNDQVLVDIKLFLRAELKEIVVLVKSLFDQLQGLSEKHKNHLLPGYTHFQLAMPSSFGLWFGAYAESLVDDLITVEAAFQIVNKNPLGSAAGYGSSFPLNRKMTTQLLGFSDLNYNVVYAQMGRGKAERVVANALAAIAATLSKFSSDVVLFINQNFGFITLPDEFTTGSSIMPHKKNPDVFELIRGRCNDIMGLPNALALMTTNLPSGYHRDMQLLKEKLFPGIQNLKECLTMTHLMVSSIEVKENILADEKYKFLFSVEEVNKLVLNGVPFREAYKQIGISIENGSYTYSTEVNHTHEGSIGNLCNREINSMMDSVLSRFGFQSIDDAIARLLK